jgi:hypothetical protein
MLQSPEALDSERLAMLLEELEDLAKVIGVETLEPGLSSVFGQGGEECVEYVGDQWHQLGDVEVLSQVEADQAERRRRAADAEELRCGESELGEIPTEPVGRELGPVGALHLGAARGGDPPSLLALAAAEEDAGGQHRLAGLLTEDLPAVLEQALLEVGTGDRSIGRLLGGQ